MMKKVLNEKKLKSMIKNKKYSTTNKSELLEEVNFLNFLN